MKLVMLILSLFFLTTTFSQARKEIVFSEKISRNELLNNQIIYNTKTNNTAMFLYNKDQIYARLFDDSLKLIQKYTCKGIQKKGKYIGSSTSEKNYTLFFKKNKTIYSKTIDFKNRKDHTNLQLEITNNGEFFLESFDINNKFYIITGVINSPYLKIYEFTENKLTNKKILELKNKYKNWRGKEKFLSEILYEINHNTKAYRFGQTSSLKLNFSKVEPYMELDIAKAKEQKKIFHFDSKVVFSLNIEKGLTNFIEIDVNDYRIEYTSLNADQSNRLINTFIRDDKIFQLVVISNDFYIAIYDYKTKKLLKKQTTKDGLIPFRSTKFINNGYIHGYNNSLKKELKDTEKFISRMYKGELFIYVFLTKNNNYQIEIGNYEESSVGGGIATSNFMNVSYSSEVISTSHIWCSFDENLNFLDEPIKNNSYDLYVVLRNKELMNKINNSHSTIILKNKMLLSYFIRELHSQELMLNLVKFED